MNRALLERLGPDALRRLARQIGLPGALHHPWQTLLVGLCAYYERCPPAGEDDEAPLDEPPRPGELPPAMATETMARVLEAQGKARRAAALRKRVAQKMQGDADTNQDEVHFERADTAAVTLRFRLSARPGEPVLSVFFWSDRHPPEVRHLPLAANEGELALTPPVDARLACALLGRRPAQRDLEPLCRTPLMTLGEPPEAEVEHR